MANQKPPAMKKTSKININTYQRIRRGYSKVILVLTVLFFSGSGFCFSKSTKNTMQHYLDKTDSICISIKGRAITDLKEWIRKSSPTSPEGKLMEEKVKALTKDKQSQMGELFQKSINNYTTQAHFNEETFMLVLSTFKEMEEKGMVEKWDVRIQSLDSNKYLAEFWADSLSVSSEIAIVLELNKMSNEYAKEHSEGDYKNGLKLKETNVKKSIDDVKQEQYNKVMALIYSQEKNGFIFFIDPFQPLIDFINR